MSEKTNKTRNFEVENPVPGAAGHFGLILPTNISEESIAIVTRQIEFRRRCMNQGFDNLLELLELSRKALICSGYKEECDEELNGKTKEAKDP